MCATASSESYTGSNPLLKKWTNEPFLLPPFHSIQPSHFKEAFEHGMECHLKDLKAIVENEEEASFDNVIVAYDQAGSVLDRVSLVFRNMCSSLNTDGT
jgi:peptidyl-dipeptidase Dcp